MLRQYLMMDQENLIPIQAKNKVEMIPPSSHLSTSEKIRYLLTKFPSPQPARPNVMIAPNFGPSYTVCKDCIATDCHANQQPISALPSDDLSPRTEVLNDASRPRSGRKGKSWGIVGELVQLMQLAVTATALILYYVIYGWMQFLYTGLRMVVFFRDADGPMKITLGVVTVSSLVVGFNVLLRIHKLYVDILR